MSQANDVTHHRPGSLGHTQDALRAIIDMAQELLKDAPEIFDRDHFTTIPDGYPRGGDGVSVTSSDITDSTGETAVTRLEGKILRDVFRDYKRTYISTISEAKGALQGGRSAKRSALELADLNRGRISTLQTCQNIHGCSNTASGVGKDTLRRGRCQSCYRFLVRHQLDNPYPTNPEVPE